MSHIRVKPLALIALITTCHWAQAAELGNMEINSGVDQKLNADIPLNLAPNESTANTRVKIISSKNRNGNTDNKATPQIEINSDDGRLKLTSKQAIHSPRIDLVLEVKTDKDTQYKQFSIDLSRASEDSPLIVSPKDSDDKTQATSQPIKKYYRKRSLTPALSPSTPAKPNPENPENTVQQKPIDNSSNVNPTTHETSPIANNQPLPTEAPINNTPIQQPSATVIATTPTTAALPQIKLSWIQENAFSLITFLAGILGMLILQKLFSGKQNSVKQREPNNAAAHDKYQALQDSLVAEVEPQSETPTIANDVALFEELLRSRMQQLKQVEIIEADDHTATTDTQHSDFEDDEFGFDFDLPDFTDDQSKAK